MLFTKNYVFSPLFTATCLESRTPCCWLKLFEIYDAARGLGHTIVVTSALNKKSQTKQASLWVAIGLFFRTSSSDLLAHDNTGTGFVFPWPSHDHDEY
jgi:hypothetical protein